MEFYLYILFLVALVFSVVAQIKVSTTFSKYSRIAIGRGRKGCEVARRILDSHGLFDVRIERVDGHLTDHYDPRSKVLRLSRQVYDASTSSAVGVAAHEVGHAIQHAEGYIPVVVRSKLVPMVNFSSRFSWIVIIVGVLLSSFVEIGTSLQIIGGYFILGGIILFASTTLFHLVTLPCELNASRRALAELEYTGWYSREELRGSKKVLSAAAMTYVASLAVSALQLLRLILIFGRSRD